LCIAAIAFVYRYLPETKGLSVEQVTELFEREASGESASNLQAEPYPKEVG